MTSIPFLKRLAPRSVSASRNSVWSKVWPSAAAGALLITVPGLYIGKVIFWRGVPFWFWPSTLILSVGFFLILKMLFSRNADLFTDSMRHGGARSGGLFILFSFFSFVASFILMGYFWRTLGKIDLAFAKSDLLAAGYKWGAAEKTPELSDEKNAVYLFNQAWNVPSMRKFGSPLPIYDIPPKGRFEENTRLYGPLVGKNDLSKQSFFGKKTESEFVWKFNEDARAGRLTGEEKNYAHKLLKEHEDALLFLDRAFETKGVDWGMDDKAEFSWIVPYPEVGYSLILARLLRLRAFVQAMDGNTEGAVKSLRTGLFLGDVMGQTRTLVAVMIDATIMKTIAPSVREILPQPRSKKYPWVEILPFLQQEKLDKDFSEALQFEFFGYRRSLETITWPDFIRINKEYFLTGLNKDTGFLLGVFYYPFLLFDQASRYEADLQFMKCINRPDAWYLEIENYLHSGWLLGMAAMRGISQMVEKVNESMTRCNRAEIAIEAGSFHQKNKRWPATVEELEEMSSDNWNSISGYSGSLPEVKVTGAFNVKENNPRGNQVTLANRGEVPVTAGVGWMYDSNLGSVYVNSTVRDSKSVPYSFYGFE